MTEKSTAEKFKQLKQRNKLMTEPGENFISKSGLRKQVLIFRTSYKEANLLLKLLESSVLQAATFTQHLKRAHPRKMDPGS